MHIQGSDRKKVSKNGWLVTGQIKNFCYRCIWEENKTDFLASTISEMRKVKKCYAGTTTVLVLSV